MPLGLSGISLWFALDYIASLLEIYQKCPMYSHCMISTCPITDNITFDHLRWYLPGFFPLKLLFFLWIDAFVRRHSHSLLNFKFIHLIMSEYTHGFLSSSMDYNLLRSLFNAKNCSRFDHRDALWPAFWVLLISLPSSIEYFLAF